MMPRMMAIVVVSVAPLLAQAGLVLQGRVVRLGSTDAVPSARIVAAKVGGEVADYRTVTADTDGRFVFRDLAAGRYRLYAQHDSYGQAEYGRRPAGTVGTPIDLAPGAAPAEVLISMTPPGVITGRVLDAGRPARRVLVRALQSSYFDGRRSLSPTEYATTDDRGEYRLFGLAPGTYLVSAIPPPRPRIDGSNIVTPIVPTIANGNRRQSDTPLTPETLTAAALDPHQFPPVYYPGTTSVADAVSIDLSAGAVVSGIDLTIARALPLHVRGRVIVADGSDARTIGVGISPDGPGTPPQIPGVEAVGGVFDLKGVLPGRYLVTASTNASSTLMRASVAIDVADRDLDNVTVTILPPVTIAGQLSIEGRTLAATDLPLILNLNPSAGGGGYSAIVSADGSFSFKDVSIQDYRFRVNIPATKPLWVKAARYGNADVAIGPLELAADPQGRRLDVSLGTQPASIDVLLVDGRQQPIAGALVMIVPDVARRQRSQFFRNATSDASGHAKLMGIAPGDYTLFGTEDIPASAWQDPALLRKYESLGVPIRLTEGSTATATVKVIR